MINLRPYSDDKDLANAVAEFLYDHGQEAVKNVRKYDKQGDQFYESLIAQLGSHYSQLSQLMNLTMNAQASMMGHEIVAKLMLSAWSLGTAAAVAPEVQQKLNEWQTAKMREAKAEKPEERALSVAIEAELKGREFQQPKKEAGAMLSAVNARLAETGHKPVSLDTIFRRLKKLVRSQRSHL